MRKNLFKVDSRIVWLLLVGHIFFIVLGTITKVQHLAFSEIALTFGFMLFFATWIIAFSDILRNNIYNRPFWIVSMIIMPNIALFFYLFKRNKLIRLGRRYSEIASSK